MFTQTILSVIAFVVLLAMAPWAIKALKRRAAGGNAGAVAGAEPRVVSALAVGPQQRVVTVEVGPEYARTWLVLGVTAQSIRTLHSVPVARGADAVPAASAVRSFEAAVRRAEAADAAFSPGQVRPGDELRSPAFTGEGEVRG